MYDYVKRTYAVSPVVGGWVWHKVTREYGKIANESPSQEHYVMVKFNRATFASPCHPTELDYDPAMVPTQQSK